MVFRQCFLTANDCYKSGRGLVPKGIMVHSTGANNPRLSRYVGPDDGYLGVNIYNNHWNQPKPEGKQICCHAFIGKLEKGTVATYQTLPWTMEGWHCGGSANKTHISFEICEDGLTSDTYFSAIYQEATELCAYLCRTFSLDPAKDGVLIDHSDGHRRGIASNHADVGHWFPRHGASMEKLRAAVLDQLETTEMYRVRKTWKDAAKQKGAFRVLDYAIACAIANPGYKVFNQAGAEVYPKRAA